MTPFYSRGPFNIPPGAGQLGASTNSVSSYGVASGPLLTESLLRRCFFRRAQEQVAVDVAPVTSEFGGLRRTEKMARLEAALFVSETPLSVRKLAQYATLADSAEVTRLIEDLNSSYDAGGSSFRIEQVASGYQMLTRPVFATWLSRLHQRQLELKLSPPALETLTIVAYRQPITRADIEAIRGVQCSEMLKQLMERGLVRIGGEDDSLGRPYLYETTRYFLETFGLRNLNQLPMGEQLRRPGGSKPDAPSTDAEMEEEDDEDDLDDEEDEDFDEDDFDEDDDDDDDEDE